MNSAPKTIVTHHHPDLDAITAVWLIRRCRPGWEDVQIKFVSAGETYKDQPPDADPDIVHVDTGMGKYDHHQTDEFICAALLVYRDIEKSNPDRTNEALERLVDVVNRIDHFQEVFWPQPAADRYEFMVFRIIDGWLNMSMGDRECVEWTYLMLDGIYQALSDKVEAEKELEEKGIKFTSVWGSSIGIETENDTVMQLAAKQGYQVVVRKDPARGGVRIKSLPKDEIDLTPVYELMKEKDPAAHWFFHSSKYMVLNGGKSNPDMKPSKLSLREVVEAIEGINQE